MQDSGMSLSALIDAACRRGSTRGKIARAVGCSRVHLWRVEKGLVSETNRVGCRLRALLEQETIGPDQRLVDALSKITGRDLQRSEKMLHLLHSIAELVEVTKAKEPHDTALTPTNSRS